MHPHDEARTLTIWTAAILDPEAIEAEVKAAPDANALKEIVRKLGNLPGSRGRLHDTQRMIEAIDAAIQAPSLAVHVTRTAGLRAKVRELSRRGAA